MYSLYYHIRQLVTCALDDKDDLGIINCDDMDGLAICVNGKGMIEEIGTSKSLWRKFEYDSYIDCKNGSVVPGFVDSHTHPVWAGDRVHEFRMKLSGSSYLEIHKAGGGINFTVRATKEAKEEVLFQTLKQRLTRMMKHGTTTVECKTGYGLEWEIELKMLRVLTRAYKELPMDISITYLAAHAVPSGKSAEQHTEDIVNNQLPELKKLMDNGEIVCHNIDVFCEKGIFEIEDTKKILKAGKSIGLNLNVHCEELNNIGGTKMVSDLGAKAVSHLEEVDESGVDAMNINGTVAVLLPSTAYLLRLKQPPVRLIIQKGVRYALGSDFNPNAYCMSMPLIMNLACVTFRMSLTEALKGSTLNAAYSVGLEHKLGSLESGKQADFLILNTTKWENLIYQIGEDDKLIYKVVKNGKIVNF